MKTLSIEEARDLHQRFHGAIKTITPANTLVRVEFENCWSRACVQAQQAASRHRAVPHARAARTWYERLRDDLDEWFT